MAYNYETDPDIVNNLNDNEKLIAVSRISLWNYLSNFIFMGVWFIILLFLLFGVNENNLVSWAGDGVNGFLAGPRYEYLNIIAPYTNKWWFWLLKLIPVWFIWSSLSSLLYGYAAIKLILTDQRVIISSNFITQETVDYRLTKIESVIVSQDINGKMFGYGNLRLRGEGGTVTEMQGFKDIVDFKKLLLMAQRDALAGEK